jgi:hypothetical protein
LFGFLLFIFFLWEIILNHLVIYISLVLIVIVLTTGLTLNVLLAIVVLAVLRVHLFGLRGLGVVPCMFYLGLLFLHFFVIFLLWSVLDHVRITI